MDEWGGGGEGGRQSSVAYMPTWLQKKDGESPTKKQERRGHRESKRKEKKTEIMPEKKEKKKMREHSTQTEPTEHMYMYCMLYISRRHERH